VVLGLKETEVVSALWWNVEEQESERSSLGFVRGRSIAIFCLFSLFFYVPFQGFRAKWKNENCS